RSARPARAPRARGRAGPRSRPIPRSVARARRRGAAAWTCRRRSTRARRASRRPARRGRFRRAPARSRSASRARAPRSRAGSIARDRARDGGSAAVAETGVGSELGGAGGTALRAAAALRARGLRARLAPALDQLGGPRPQLGPQLGVVRGVELPGLEVLL